jgi:hypothetical protein
VKLDLSSVQFSRNDIKRGITVPAGLTTDLSEILGILIGDGHVGIYSHAYRVIISGDLRNDYEYYNGFLIPLFQNMFNIKPCIKTQRINELNLAYSSKALTTLFKHVFNIPQNKKNVSIPSQILNSNNDIKAAFLRGLADTDFSLTFKKKFKNRHYYPRICAKFGNGHLVEETVSMLRSLGFSKIVTFATKNRRGDKWHDCFVIDINGRDNLDRWMRLIGFDNPKHVTKYEVWRKYGFCPPYTNIEERKKMLDGSLNIVNY